MPVKQKTLAVIGGGAAGFFCAINAARLQPALRVILLEKTSKLLSKVRISGGGRCNVTHSLFDLRELSRRYPRGEHFVRKAFHQFSTTDTINWFEERGLKLKAEADGRMFPVTNNSQSVIDCLLKEANSCKVDVRLNAEVKELKSKDSNQWQITTTNGQQTTADFLCLATGGYPKLSMFDWLRESGHSISEPVPSLFTFNLPKHPITTLMGVSVETARVKIEQTKLQEEGPLLITHWGLSGPAVLRLSAWGARELKLKNYEFKVHINWLPQSGEKELKVNFQELRRDAPTKKILNHNFGKLPGRLWQFFLEQSGINADTRFADLTAKAENLLIKSLVDYVVDVKGKTTFKEEFVTAGGIHLSEVDANTMMSKKRQNLFFAGEVLDVDGITGGFNFQHAWTSGWIAAKSIARLCS